MSGLIVPLADLAGGRAPQVRVEADGGGEAVARFGQALGQIGEVMETDRLDREMVVARSRIQRDLGQLAQEMDGIGDPDALDRTWAERSTALRAEVLAGVDPRNRARAEASYDELANGYTLRVGAKAIAARDSAWRAALDEQVYAYVGAAPGADAETRAVGRDHLADTVAKGVAEGRLTPEQAGDILRQAGADGERAALVSRLDTDPEGALAALEAGEYVGIDPIYAEGAKSTARAKIAQRDAQAATEAERQATARQKEIGDRLADVTTNARAGRVNTWEGELMADPEVQAHPGYAEAAAAIALRTEMPGFAGLPPAQQQAAIEAEAAKTVTDPWENKRVEAMRASAKAAGEGWKADPMAQAANLGMTPPQLADPSDPAAFATSLAARRGFALSLRERGYVAAPVFFSAEERATLAAATAPSAGAESRAALAQSLVSAFGKDAPRALAEIRGDDVFAHMGSLASSGGRPALVAEAFRGQQAIDEKVVALPKDADRRLWADEVLGDVLAGDAQTEGRVLRAADAIYAARAPRTGDPDATVYKAALQEALGADADAGTGGIQRLRGVKVALPIGVRAEDVEAALDRAAEGDVAARLRAASASGGEALYAGQPVDARALDGVRLRSVGNGLYTLSVERYDATSWRWRKRDVTDSVTGKPYVLRLSRLLDGAGAPERSGVR